MNNKRLLFILISLLLVSCTNGCSISLYHIYSLDKKKCITIITEGDIRYIINGCVEDVPDTNYVKINLKNIDREVGDEIVGLWKVNSKGWIVMNDDAVILANKLDSSNYIFKDKFPVDKNGIPNLDKFRGQNSFDLGYFYRKIQTTRGATAKYVFLGWFELPPF